MTLLLLFQGYKIPASQTPEGKKRITEYYEALGRFVDMFSRVEAAVTLTLWHYAKTEPAISKVIFAGARVENSSTYIKQIATATGATKELQEDLEEVFQQLNIIRGARNDILHYGAEPESVAKGTAVISDALKAKGEPIIFPINPKLLDQMTNDLHKIIAHLKISHLGDSKSYTLAGDPRYGAWQYKHPVQQNRPAKKGKGQRS
jgi:hypothetical protein